MKEGASELLQSLLVRHGIDPVHGVILMMSIRTAPSCSSAIRCAVATRPAWSQSLSKSPSCHPRASTRTMPRVRQSEVLGAGRR